MPRKSPVTDASPDVPLAEVPPVWTSPSFWVTLLPVVSAVLGFFLHKQIDLSALSAGLSLIAASLASAGLAIARSMRHRALLEANTAKQALSSAVPDDVEMRLRELEASQRARTARRTTQR